MDLQSPVQYVKGVGPQRAEALRKLGIATVEDLLLHVPMRYEDRTQFARVADLKPGMKCSVSGRLVVAGLRRARRMTLYEARLDDGSGRLLKALWFNQPFLKDVLKQGSRVVLFGAVEKDSYGSRQLVMMSPQYEVFEEDAEAPGIHTGRMVPVYEKLGPLTGKALRRVLFHLAQQIPETLEDPLPPEIRQRLGVDRTGRGPAPDPRGGRRGRSRGAQPLPQPRARAPDLGGALPLPARPGPTPARSAEGKRKGTAFAITDATRELVKKILPFPLTGAQKRVLREIADDMRSPHPMNRLIQGDVGSGKTIVALLAMAVALEDGYQAAFMAPTEILAEQHFLTFRRLLARTPYRPCLLTSTVKGKEREAARTALASGEARIAVGTHALIQGGVEFQRLGLAVVDEQHRFGVLQRDDLRKKGYDVDVLVMTATPIPRTLALTAYGDLDVSLVDEKPPGRTPIETRQRTASDRREVLDLARRAVREGRQVYVVYPLIEESEKLEDVRAATEAATSGRGPARGPGGPPPRPHEGPRRRRR